MRHFLVLALLLKASNLPATTSPLLCDWTHTVRSLSTFCDFGFIPSPLEDNINFGICEDGTSSCDSCAVWEQSHGGVFLLRVPEFYECLPCTTDDVCQPGETMGTDCFCGSQEDLCQNGLLKEDSSGVTYCEQGSGLVCPKNYNKELINNGFQRYYKCNKVSSTGGTGTGGSGTGGSGTGGSGTGGSGTGGSGTGGGSGTDSECYIDSNGTEQKCDDETPWAYSPTFDCSAAAEKAGQLCQAFVSRATPDPHEGCPDCGVYKCGEGKESEGYYTVLACGNVWGWGMFYKECTSFSERCVFGKCSDGKRTVPADEKAVVEQSCKHMPKSSGCSPCGSGTGSGSGGTGGGGEVPTTQAECEAANMKWVGADNGVGMCHPKDGDGGTGGGGGTGSGGSGTGGSGNGTGDFLTNEEYTAGIENTKEHISNIFGEKPNMSEEQLKPANFDPKTIKSDVRKTLENTKSDVLKLMEKNGKMPSTYFPDYILNQSRSLFGNFKPEAGSCELALSFFDKEFELFDKTYKFIPDASRPELCKFFEVLSVLVQFFLYLRLLIYLFS